MPVASRPMLTLGDFTNAALMLPRLRGCSMGEVIHELGQALHQENGSLPDIVYPGLNALNCELLTSLVLDLGAAFPVALRARSSRRTVLLACARLPAD
jgi:hypothetical protein